jgi:hypothetical protein
MARIDDSVKQAAYAFLNNLEEALNDRLPNPSMMRESVRKIISESKIAKSEGDNTKSHLTCQEWVFINHYTIPVVAAVMQKVDGIGATETREALLCEFWRSSNMGTYCLQSGSRTTQSPFIKAYLEKSGLEIMKAWKAGEVQRACPDFAFGNPFPYKIVFEGKYFEGGDGIQATKALVTNIREAFFYRCFPYAPFGIKKPEWDYDFSCAIVYDASDEGLLEATWDEIPDHVRASFWEGANLYVMIIRGKSNNDDRA